MLKSHRVLMLAATLSIFVGGCNSVPLPEEMPQDFYYSWRFDRLEPSDAPNPGDRPESIFLSMDPAGLVRYEVRWGDPRPVEKEGEVAVDLEARDAIYQAVRGAGLFEKSNSYQGQELALGRETFYVVGRNTTKEVVVEGTSLSELSSLRETFIGRLPMAEIVARPAESVDVYILDWRTGVFHKGDCPLVNEIPEESRRKFPHPFAALDAKGRPCEQCQPMGGE